MSKKKQRLGPLQKEWVRCLRDKRFRQTTGELFGRYVKSGEVMPNCCLGVACCVAPLGGVTFDEEWYLLTMLPPNVRMRMKFHDAWGGLVGARLKVGDREKFTDLAAANDFGVTFAHIADFVEANPEAVFTGPA